MRVPVATQVFRCRSVASQIDLGARERAVKVMCGTMPGKVKSTSVSCEALWAGLHARNVPGDVDPFTAAARGGFIDDHCAAARLHVRAAA